MVERTLFSAARRASVIMLLSLLCLLGLRCAGERTVHILWDDWGVPHIHGPRTEDVFYAFGWAQMKSHADVILRAYGEARGKAAEYWGESYLESDKIIHSLDVPSRAARWLDAQGSQYRALIEFFVSGMNDYADGHGSEISEDVKIVLPVKPTDVLAHLQRVWHLLFLAGSNFNTARAWAAAGSNAWAIAPSRSSSGRAMLLLDPHLYWTGFLMFFEAHLTGPDLNAYGAAILGMPFLIMGFNDRLGWTNTVNTIDGADVYELTLREGGYAWEGTVKPFETETLTLQIRQSDGTLREGELTVSRSIHGPVIAQKEGKALAIRIAGLDQPGIVEQAWDIMRSRNLGDFEKALSRLQLPLLNFLYADKDGHILYVFNGRIPRRPQGDWSYWSGVVPGDTSRSLWTDTLEYDELPRVVDPPSGWLQNSNDPPWICTFPRVLNPDDYPSYLTPRLMGLRAQNAVRMLMADDSITFDEMIDYKMSTRMELADRILDDLLPAARRSDLDAADRAADILESWDRHADAGSRGAVLFHFWTREIGGNLFERAWDPDDPLNTPDGLADPNAAVAALIRAATRVERLFGRLDVAWGEVFRLRYAGLDLPARGGPGALGVFNVLTFVEDSDGKYSPRHGEGFIAAVEFGERLRAKALLVYGNATQPGSPHSRVDQMELFSRGQLRDVRLTRGDIEAHLESEEELISRK